MKTEALVNKVNRHGGAAVLGINRHIHQGWDSWKNLHQRPEVRLYGLADESEDIAAQSDAQWEDMASTPQVRTVDYTSVIPATPPAFVGTNTSSGSLYGTTSYSTPPITSTPSPAATSILSSIMNFAAFKSGAVVGPKGQLLNPATASYLTTQKQTNLAMIGAGLLALYLITKKG